MLKVSSDRNNTYEALRLSELPDMHMESISRKLFSIISDLSFSELL